MHVNSIVINNLAIYVQHATDAHALAAWLAYSYIHCNEKGSYVHVLAMHVYIV